MLTGLTIARNNDQPIRFLTLTTDENNRVYKKDGTVMTLRDSWQRLREYIQRFFHFKLNKYYCLRTSEGKGVLHIIFWGGKYLPQWWISRAWKKIHGAYIVDIRYVHKTRHRISGLVGYLLDRYLLNQPIERMSYGWGWAWLGFCKSWDHVKKTHGCLKRGIKELRPAEWIKKFNFTWDWYREHVVPFSERYDCKQAVPFWRGLLLDHPITSRQTKFYYPNRGYNKKFFNLGGS